MLAHSYYEEDARVRREAEALVAAGRPVDVFALRRDGDAPDGVVDGVRIFRLPIQRHQGGLSVYVREYSSSSSGPGLPPCRPSTPDYALIRSTRCPTSSRSPGCLPDDRRAGRPRHARGVPDLFGHFPAAGKLLHGILRLQEDLAIGRPPWS
jgi:hypothetical protein